MITDNITIEVLSDYDGYFESLVRLWIDKKTDPLKHSKFIISAGPWRSSVVTYKSEADTLYLDFYSAFRKGFGELSEQEVKEIIEIL